MSIQYFQWKHLLELFYIVLLGRALLICCNNKLVTRVVESESVESHVFSWSRSRFSKLLESGVGVGFSKLLESESGAGVGIRSWSRKICCNYRLQCLLNIGMYRIVILPDAGYPAIY